MPLQPLKKSFPYYIQLGMEYGSKKKVTKSQNKLLTQIAIIDDAILIIDDIIDNSLLRNNKPCLYREIGVSKSIITAELLKSKAITKLISLMKVSKTKPQYQVLVLEKINLFLDAIYLGEKINLNQVNTNQTIDYQLKNYFKMIKLFTGGHIKFGLEIGQLIVNKIPAPQLSKIGESAGIVRQIIDDYYDYFKNHHEPFGDFIFGDKRLPEILFYKFGGTRNNALVLIKAKKYKQVRLLILNEHVRTELHSICNKEVNKIKRIKVNFDYKTILEELR